MPRYRHIFAGADTGRVEIADAAPAIHPDKGFWALEINEPSPFDPATQRRSGPTWTITEPVVDGEGVVTVEGTIEAAYVVDDRPLPELIAVKVAAIDAKRDHVLALGASVGGRRIALSDGARADISGMAVTAVAVLGGAVPWPETYALGWIAIDNTRVAMAAAADGIALAAACGAYYAAAVQNARTLKDQALEAETAEDLAAIDIDAGWPE